MSITPVGGWNDKPKEGRIVLRDTPEYRPPANLVQQPRKSGHTVFGFLLGVICAACFLVFAGFVASQLITANQSPSRKIAISSSTASRTIPSKKSYDLFSLNNDKNRIPTGTALTIKGFFYQAVWTHLLRCDQVLMYGRAPIQHGEADPSSYCRFSVLLTEKRPVDGGDTMPALGAVCDVTAAELKEDLKIYHYNDQIQASGLYAPSLDFAVSPFGIPLLDNCTITHTMHPRPYTKPPPNPNAQPYDW
jgi:hypothetical protein